MGEYPLNVGGVPTPATVEFDTQYEYGLRLPDGTIRWPGELFYGSDFQTPEQRTAILVAIKNALEKMSFPPHFIDEFKWLRREKRVVTVCYEGPVEAHDLVDPNLLESHANDGLDSAENASSTPVEESLPPVGKGWVQS